jgi:threonine/homoserine/homoserine lactone efflux protein
VELILKGAVAGITLSFLIGPVFFALIQVGISKGFRAGLAMCSGIWLSDFLIIIVSYLGISYILMFTKWEGFAPFIGTLGGMILIGFGVGSWYNIKKESTKKFEDIKHPSIGVLSAKGFLINSFNPFTILFWLGLMSTIVADQAQSGKNALLFFTPLLSMVIVFDLLKIGLAKKISKWLLPAYVMNFRRAIGILLILFGGIMIWRVW